MSVRQFLAILIVGFGLTLAVGNAAEPEVQGLPDFQAQIEQAKQRLNLTDAQVEQIRPILKDSLETSMQVLDKHGIDLSIPKEQRERPSFREMRAIKKDMDDVREATTEKLAAILSDEQLEMYKDIQEERREQMREQIRAGR